MPLANLLKRNSKLFAAALLVALASSVAGRSLLWLLHPSTMIRCRVSTA